MNARFPDDRSRLNRSSEPEMSINARLGKKARLGLPAALLPRFRSKGMSILTTPARSSFRAGPRTSKRWRGEAQRDGASQQLSRER